DRKLARCRIAGSSLLLPLLEKKDSPNIHFEERAEHRQERVRNRFALVELERREGLGHEVDLLERRAIGQSAYSPLSPLLLRRRQLVAILTHERVELLRRRHDEEALVVTRGFARILFGLELDTKCDLTPATAVASVHNANRIFRVRLTAIRKCVRLE